MNKHVPPEQLGEARGPAASRGRLVHRWHVDEREYRRHELRRGRLHAYETLDPRRVALVVVDMIEFFVVDNPYCAGIVPTIDALADAVRSSGGLVAWVIPRDDDPTGWQVEFFGPTVASRYARSGGGNAPRERLWSELRIGEGDVVVEKSAPSAFFPGRCSLHEVLAGRSIDTVLVTGTVANVCCESTARDAATLGYKVVMVADANAARRDEDLNATLHTIYRSFGDVRSAGEVIDLLHGA